MPPKSGRIFRQVALDRLSSPEQVDTLMRVLNPAGWLALGTVFLVLAVGLAWGIFGRIPVRVAGQGVLLRSGGIFLVPSSGSGELQSLDVAVGDSVQAGQVIARVAQPDLEQQLAAAREQLAATRSSVGEQAPLDARDAALSARSLSYQHAAAEAKLETLKAEVERLQRKVEEQKALVDDGVVTEDVLAQARLDLGQAKSQMIAGQADVEQLEAEQAKATASLESSRAQRKSQVDQAEQQVALLEERLRQSSQVVADQAGRVVEVVAGVGDLVQAGGPVVAVERPGAEGRRLQLVAYLSALDAYEVSSGMEVQVVPSVVKKEESGSMLGKVVSVADVPAEQQDMLRVLGNQPLVQDLSRTGLPIEVRADLAVDPSTPSGYRWTSAEGPRVRLHDGTLCTVSVVVREQAPITLAIPGLEKALGL